MMYSQETIDKVSKLYNFIFDNIENNNFQIIDKIFDDVDLNDNDVVLLAPVTGTFTIKNLLNNRQYYYNQVKNKFLEKHSVEKTEKLLQGLE